MKALIFLPIFIDSCSESSGGQMNTGSSSQCLEGVTNKLVLAKSQFRFATLASFKTEADWATAIEAKNIVPLFGVYEVVDENTEPTKYTSGNFSYVTEKEVKKMSAESYLSICSHKALKSYQVGDYTQVFEITDKGEVLGVYDTDGVQVKGQDITEFDVQIRSRPTKEKPAFSKQMITYRDFEEFEDNGIIVKEAWDIQTLNGIFGLTLEVQGTPTATEIQVKALLGCGNSNFSGLVLADWAYTGGTITVSTYDAVTGIYTLEGVGLTSGNLTTDGVITVSSWLYEGETVAVTI